MAVKNARESEKDLSPKMAHVPLTFQNRYSIIISTLYSIKLINYCTALHVFLE
jgi:hypothetical protein